MAEQGVLAFDDDRTIDEAFAEFHEAHPEVYEHFKTLANQLRSRGHKRYGAKGIVEVIRFHRATTGPDVNGFKINNNFTSRYARMLIEEDPSFDGFFEMRRLKSQETEC